MYDESKIEIGDTVIATWINSLLDNSEQHKQYQEPMLIDTTWNPRSLRRPTYNGYMVHLYIGDKLTIISNGYSPAIDGSQGHCDIYQVQDKGGNKFYLSGSFFYKEPAQLSLPFEEKK